MSESFYLSNISPQVPAFNRGIWKRLEEKVRYWAEFNDSLYVVTGPILASPIDNIGDNDVTVPRSFYKSIIGFKNNKLKGIGFVMPNQSSNKSIYLYATTIDEIEKLTGIDFFYKLDKKLQEEIESNKDVKKWFPGAEEL
jgi:endonuclease G